MTILIKYFSELETIDINTILKIIAIIKLYSGLHINVYVYDAQTYVKKNSKCKNVQNVNSEYLKVIIYMLDEGFEYQLWHYLCRLFNGFSTTQPRFEPI